MANTEGLAFMVFFVNGSILVGFVLMLSRLQGVRSWWSKEEEGKTGYGYALVVLFFHWAILPIQDVGDGLSFLDPESTYLTWWIYYWTDWGMRATLLLIDIPPYALLVIIGGIWPVHYLHRPGGFMTIIAYGVGMPVVYTIGVGWILIPFLI